MVFRALAWQFQRWSWLVLAWCLASRVGILGYSICTILIHKLNRDDSTLKRFSAIKSYIVLQQILYECLWVIIVHIPQLLFTYSLSKSILLTQSNYHFNYLLYFLELSYIFNTLIVYVVSYLFCFFKVNLAYFSIFL